MVAMRYGFSPIFISHICNTAIISTIYFFSLFLSVFAKNVCVERHEMIYFHSNVALT
jgi:hypothetical protein